MNEKTHVKRIVFPHFAHELPANPGTNLGSTFLVEPPKFFYCLDNPLALALLGEYVSEPSIVRSAPERKIEKEKELAGCGRQGVKKDELERKEAKVEDVDARFWVGRVEERCDDVVRCWDTEYCMDGRPRHIRE